MRTLRPFMTRVRQNHGSRRLLQDAQLPGMCLACRLQTFSDSDIPLFLIGPSRASRYFSTYSRRLQDKPLDNSQKPNENSQSQTGPAVRTVSDEELPSHREKTRYDISRRTHAYLDNLMQKLAVAGQRINDYTGTDYTGIEGLRREIKEQEQLVKSRREAVQIAKATFEAADTQRVASQKEVVGLLERKSSWTSGDLERYMALIRSEHANDQAVQIAKDLVTSAEQALEYARARLEKRERDQYHEEQIWSDTIRRNSSWVTFGLMGVNIMILLVNLVAIEPWRRKRLVKEFREALDERTMPIGVSNIEPEAIFVAEAPQTEVTDIVEIVEAPKDELAQVTSEVVQEGPQNLTLDGAKSYIEGLFSNQTISLQRVELTATVLQSAAVGAALAGSLLFALRPR